MPYYDYYDFFECRLQPLSIEGSRMTVTIHNLGLMPNHPLNPSDGLLYLEDCKVVFKGVVRSERAVFEYIGDPMQGRFRAERKVSDGLFPSNDEANLTFNLEGILEEPMSWVNWRIECVSFHLEVPDKPVLKESPV